MARTETQINRRVRRATEKAGKLGLQNRNGTGNSKFPGRDWPSTPALETTFQRRTVKRSPPPERSGYVLQMSLNQRSSLLREERSARLPSKGDRFCDRKKDGLRRCCCSTPILRGCSRLIAASTHAMDTWCGTLHRQPRTRHEPGASAHTHQPPQRVNLMMGRPRSTTRPWEILGRSQTCQHRCHWFCRPKQRKRKNPSTMTRNLLNQIQTYQQRMYHVCILSLRKLLEGLKMKRKCSCRFCWKRTLIRSS